MLTRSSPLSAVSVDYLEALEERYRTDPDSIDQGWRYIFDVLRDLEIAGTSRSKIEVAAAIATAYRDRGHLASNLDPLSSGAPAYRDELTLAHIASFATRFAGAAGKPGGDAALIERFRSKDCSTLAVETAHIDEQ